MDQFKNKYRIPSARAQWWDYGNDAAYFITICTKNRSHFFGKITDQKLFASPAGDIAANIWHEIPANFPYAQLGAFVVMPNHVHGIIIIEKTVSDVAVPLHPASQSKAGGFAGSDNPMLNENLSRIGEGGTRGGVRSKSGRSILHFNGNPVFMTILSGMTQHISELMIISKTTPQTGVKTNSPNIQRCHEDDPYLQFH
jgi:hypothetical protein